MPRPVSGENSIAQVGTPQAGVSRVAIAMSDSRKHEPGPVQDVGLTERELRDLADDLTRAESVMVIQGTDPNAWRSDAIGERITFTPGVLTDTMRWVNKPTFHQLMEFGGHR